MGGAEVSVQSTLYKLLKNSVYPSTELRANGISLEITSKYPFMLSQVEACKCFSTACLHLTPPLASISKFAGFFIAFAFADLVFAER
jgi:hypothetical protein